MALTLEVSLVSGRAVSLEAGSEDRVEAVKSRAEEALNVGKGRLIDWSGRVLDGSATLRQACF